MQNFHFLPNVTVTFLSELQLPVIKPKSMAELPTTLTNKPNTQVKECHLYMYMLGRSQHTSKKLECHIVAAAIRVLIFKFLTIRLRVHSKTTPA